MSFSEKYWKEFDKFLPELMREESVEISITVEAQKNPGFLITINGQEVSKQILANGDTTITLIHEHIDEGQQVSIDFSMYGKTNTDTVIDANGQILEDKFVIIKSLFINKISLISDLDFFYGENLTYHDSDGNLKPMATGFWFNDTLKISYERPFSLWYNQRTSRNKKHSHAVSAKHDGQLVDELWNSVITNVSKLEDF